MTNALEKIQYVVGIFIDIKKNLVIALMIVMT